MGYTKFENEDKVRVPKKISANLNTDESVFFSKTDEYLFFIREEKKYEKTVCKLCKHSFCSVVPCMYGV